MDVQWNALFGQSYKFSTETGGCKAVKGNAQEAAFAFDPLFSGDQHRYPSMGTMSKVKIQMSNQGYCPFTIQATYHHLAFFNRSFVNRLHWAVRNLALGLNSVALVDRRIDVAFRRIGVIFGHHWRG
jgi:hypothetical protein